ncbi:MAG: histone deacetylase family protein [Chloroflexota bacterium]
MDCTIGAVDICGRSPAIIYHPLFLAHDTGAHPETAARLVRVRRHLEARGLWSANNEVTPGPAPEQWLLKVHSADYLRSLQSLCARGGGILTLDPTVASPRSYEAALYAVGAGLRAVDLLYGATPRPSFALVRPPGHHAERDQALGFCLLNNVAVAAEYARDRYRAERIMIVDFDVHHGNGTQNHFYGDGSVLYVSTHQSPLYPGTGLLQEIGQGAGRGANINLPLPPLTGDEGFATIVGEVLVPAARRFRPQLVLVSAGFDGHWRDPLAELRLSVKGYGAAVAVLCELAAGMCAGRIAFLLEGGYDLDVLPLAVAATLDVMAGQSVDDPLGPAPNPGVEPRLDTLVATARRLHAL